MKPISYVSDQAKDYHDSLTQCKSLSDLTELLESYRTIFPDALQQAPKDDKEFDTFMSGLREERRGKFAGEEFVARFGAVLLPELMMRVGIVANQYLVPWGCAFMRLKDFKHIQFDECGVARWVQHTESPSGEEE